MLIVDKLLSHDDGTCTTCYWLSAEITPIDVRLNLGVCPLAFGHGFEALLSQRWRRSNFEIIDKKSCDWFTSCISVCYGMMEPSCWLVGVLVTVINRKYHIWISVALLIVLLISAPYFLCHIRNVPGYCL